MNLHFQPRSFFDRVVLQGRCRLELNTINYTIFGIVGFCPLAIIQRFLAGRKSEVQIISYSNLLIADDFEAKSCFEGYKERFYD